MQTLLKPAYQPIVDLRTNQPSHYEALARIALDETGTAHLKLIELAENCRFVQCIDLAMAELVLGDARHHAFRLAINVSPHTIDDAMDDLMAVFAAHADLMPRLMVEITERQPVRDLTRLHRFIASVRVLGGQVALDDFGRGCFTEGMVRLIKPDYLKVDGVVLERTVASGDCTELRQAMQLVGGIGADLIVEFVDTPRKAALAQEMGIRYAQGSLFGMPTWTLPGHAGVGRMASDVRGIAASYQGMAPVSEFQMARLMRG